MLPNEALAKLGPTQKAALVQIQVALAAIEHIQDTIGSAGNYSWESVADTLPDVKYRLDALIVAVYINNP
jgi:hypothetical protein